MKDDYDKQKAALDFLNLYQTQYSLTDKIWGYFSTVSLGLLVLIIGGKSLITNGWHVAIVIIGYIVFCVGNFQALMKAQKQLSEFAANATKATENAGIAFKTLMPFKQSQVSKFYWPVVIAVIIGILVIYNVSSDVKQVYCQPCVEET